MNHRTLPRAFAREYTREVQKFRGAAPQTRGLLCGGEFLIEFMTAKYGIVGRFEFWRRTTRCSCQSAVLRRL